MYRPASLRGTAHRGSFLCEGWELRVTKRCVEEDLFLGGTGEFAKLQKGHEIVAAFVRERTDRTITGTWSVR